jgi:hypothetical protein
MRLLADYVTYQVLYCCKQYTCIYIIYISEWRTIITCKLLRTPGVRYVDGPTPQCRLMKLQLPGRAVDGVWRKSGAALGPVVSACTAFVGQKTESGTGRQSISG